MSAVHVPSSDEPKLGTVNLRIWPTRREEWDHVFAAREALATADPVARFFFELDWQTEPHFGAVALRNRREPAIRAAEWPGLAMGLSRRLEARWRNARLDSTLSTDLIGRTSTVVRDASGKLKEIPLDETLIHFGAGTFRTEIEFGTSAEPGVFPVGDADSYFLWFFAEFGLLAVERKADDGFWEPILKPLILSSWLYASRFEGRRPVTSYLHAPRVLEREEIETHTASFEELWKKAGMNPAVALHKVLRAASTVYRG